MGSEAVDCLRSRDSEARKNKEKFTMEFAKVALLVIFSSAAAWAQVNVG
jgi:hypothetical protein